MHRYAMTALLLAAGAAWNSPLQSMETEKLDDCIELGEGHSLHRKNAQHLFIRDGEQHYRLSFAGGTCGDMAVTSTLTLDTDGDSNRVCPSGSTLAARQSRCTINRIERISPEDFRRWIRRR